MVRSFALYISGPALARYICVLIVRQQCAVLHVKLFAACAGNACCEPFNLSWVAGFAQGSCAALSSTAYVQHHHYIRRAQAKLWDISTGEPKLLTAKDLKAGSIFAAAFCAESPFLLAAGGAKGKLVVWDTLQDRAVAAKYGNQRPRRKGTEPTGGDDKEQL